MCTPTTHRNRFAGWVLLATVTLQFGVGNVIAATLQLFCVTFWDEKGSFSMHMVGMAIFGPRDAQKIDAPFSKRNFWPLQTFNVLLKMPYGLHNSRFRSEAREAKGEMGVGSGAKKSEIVRNVGTPIFR